MYVWTVALRYIRRRLITWLAVASIVLLVAAFVVVMSVLRGFGEFLRAGVRKTTSHVEIDRPSVEGIADYQALGERIVAADEHVVAWTPMVQGVVLVQTRRYRYFSLLKGIDLQKERQAEDLRGKKGISSIDGMPETFGTIETLPTAVIGKKLAEDLDVVKNDLLTLTVQAGTEGEASKKSFVVKAIYESGSIWFDRFVLVDFREAQKLYRMGRAVSSIGLWLDEYAHADAARLKAYLLMLAPPALSAAERAAFAVLVKAGARMSQKAIADATGLDQAALRDALVRLEARGAAQPLYKVYESGSLEPHYYRFERLSPELQRTAEQSDLYVFSQPKDLRVRTWREQQKEVFASIELQNAGMTIIFLLLAVVIALLILALMLILVGEKRRDIGVLRAVGATRGGILSIFLLNGAAIGTLGGLLGIGLGLLILWDPVMYGLLWLIGQPDLGKDLFGFNTIPKAVDPAYIVTIFLLVVCGAVAFSGIPAWLATRVDPLETIRHE